MSHATLTARHTRPAPDPPPHCCGCARPMLWSQPDPRRPGELLATCPNPACGEWSVWTRNSEGRWMTVRRISADERRSPSWPVARPSTEETARRGQS